jgi:DhnA family fructose-bisphosphate aldolase class Ia
MMTREENMDRFFGRDGKTVILPIDHGTAIPVPGMEDPIGLIEETSPHVDGYVVNIGLALAAHEQLEDKGLCLRTDCYKPAYGDNEDEGAYRIFDAEHAELIGANAVMNMLYTNHSNEAGIFREAAELIGDSLDVDVPVILESLPLGIGKPDAYTPENIGFAVRAAAELGADVVKTAFPTNGSVDDFRQIVEACFVPVIVLGGAAMGDDEALLTMVRKAVDAGASGIAVGRNVWQHSNPPAVASALNAIVHGNDKVETALKLIS